ncbi:MAG: DUF456 domain-containing protein [Spirochaetales bacterium]|uniref:DUF456 domain-containing protein n=1 Tax=Candidatus Thalassospirochaeta sargassi TaxID=3119039 RepID=A0AAJ1IJR5_9SPIO|nr:DUF456 domain-containing protein [Spirochaetales bacterium]
MVFDIVMIVLGAVLLLTGFIGCVVPVLPGPVLSYTALILVSIPAGFTLFKPATLIILAAAAVLSQILDNIFPVLSSKKAGAGKAGIWGSIIGMIIGMIFFPPLGVIIGAFTGALAGEAIFNRENQNPLKAALAVFTGTILGIIVKLTVSGIIAAVFIRGAGNLL